MSILKKNILNLNSKNRYALGLQYNGTDYYGWQRQANRPDLKTIQGCLESALSEIAQKQITVIVAGRTDKGVHAKLQIVHFDTDVSRTQEAWVFGVNRFLSPQIRVIWVKAVSREFHARYSAYTRTYEYLIENTRVCSPIFFSKATWYPKKLDIKKMQNAVLYWVGKHDFSAFRAQYCQSCSPVREVREISIQKNKDLIKIRIVANAFLYHMVRNMIGVLLAIGEGQKEVPWAKEVLLSRDRRQAGITAPPDGLYLTHIEYSKKFEFVELEVV